MLRARKHRGANLWASCFRCPMVAKAADFSHLWESSCCSLELQNRRVCGFFLFRSSATARVTNFFRKWSAATWQTCSFCALLPLLYEASLLLPLAEVAYGESVGSSCQRCRDGITSFRKDGVRLASHSLLLELVGWVESPRQQLAPSMEYHMSVRSRTGWGFP